MTWHLEGACLQIPDLSFNVLSNIYEGGKSYIQEGENRGKTSLET